MIKMKVQPLPEDEKLSRADIMRRRLNSRCKGLLEVGPDVSTISETLDTGDVSLIQHPMSVNDRLAEGTFPADFTVQYLHRTVKDFLETPRVWDRIMLAGPRTYDPYLALLRSFIARFKYLDPGSSCTEAFRLTVSACMEYAYRVQDRLEEGQSAESLVSLIDEIDRTAKNFNEVSIEEPSRPSIFFHYIDSGSYFTFGHSFLSLAVRLGLHTYVEAKVHHGCLAHNNKGIVPLLSEAIILPAGFAKAVWMGAFPSVKMVKKLFKHGADPNMVSLTNEQRLKTRVSFKHGADPNMVSLTKEQRLKTTVSSQRIPTVWHDLLRHVTESLSDISIEIWHRWAEVIYWFLVYGADATVDLGTNICALLSDHLSEEKYNRVLAIMKAKRPQTWFTKKKENPNLDHSGHLKTWRRFGSRPSQGNILAE